MQVVVLDTLSIRASGAKPRVVELTEKGPGALGIEDSRTLVYQYISARCWVQSPVLGKGLGLETLSWSGLTVVSPRCTSKRLADFSVQGHQQLYGRYMLLVY